MIFLADRCLFTRPITVPAAMFPCNPSIAPARHGYRAIVRGINYRILPDQRLHLGLAEARARSRHWLIDLDRQLRPQGTVEIDDSSMLHRLDAAATEDLRLFSWRKQWWCGGSLIRFTPAGRQISMFISRLAENRSGRPTLEDAVQLSAEGTGHQKNWLLWPHTSLQMTPWAYPLQVTCWDGDTMLPLSTPPGAPALDGWRGSSLVIPWKGGGLAILHRRRQADFGPDFEHRFVLFDKAWKLRSLSEPFRFQAPGVEFACGIAARGRRTVIGFGIMDASAHIMVMKTRDIANMLA